MIAEKPDEVHLVSTMIANPWFIHALRIDARDGSGANGAVGSAILAAELAEGRRWAS